MHDCVAAKLHDRSDTAALLAATLPALTASRPSSHA